MNNNLAVVRGAGDLATGIIYILKSFGYDVFATEIAHPSAIRRTVALCEAVYVGRYSVENVTARRCKNIDEFSSTLDAGEVPVVIDPKSEIVAALKPNIVVDAIIAKKNLGTSITMAPVVIGVGSGFTAGKDVHAVVETARGHMLGRVIYDGQATPNSGIPGNIGGYTHERVIHSPTDGVLVANTQIGDIVEKGQEIADVDGTPVTAKIGGVLRGLIRDGYNVQKGLKIADVDPRGITDHCYTISDKARMIGYGTLHAIHQLTHQGEANAD